MPTTVDDIPSGINIFRGPEFREMLNTWAEAIRQLQSAAQDDVMPHPERPFWPVRIDGYGSSPGYYQFDQVQWNDTTEAWDVVSGGMSHVTAGEARAIGGSLDTGHQSNLLGRVVYVTPRHALDGSGNVVFEFEAPPVESFWGRITGSTAIPSTTNRWRYAWTEQERSTDGFADLTGGRSGTTSSSYAINSVEANNDGIGTQGNSIDIDGADFPAGFSMQPVEGDPVVRMYKEYDASGTAFYTFAYVNAVDGTCEAP